MIGRSGLSFDLPPRPWTSRREALVSLLYQAGDDILLSENVDGEHGPAIYQAACRMGLETSCRSG
jgi:hypothetical protein